jgi:hypothetical protein
MNGIQSQDVIYFYSNYIAGMLYAISIAHFIILLRRYICKWLRCYKYIFVDDNNIRKWST